MKKVKLILASALLIGAVAVNAQDTTRVSGNQDRTGAGVGKQGDTQTQSQDFRKDMTVIQASEMPSSLRTTLGGDQYKGWESNSTIYRSKNNDSYIVEMRNGSETKIHRFDQNGKAVKDY